MPRLATFRDAVCAFVCNGCILAAGSSSGLFSTFLIGRARLDHPQRRVIGSLDEFVGDATHSDRMLFHRVPASQFAPCQM